MTVCDEAWQNFLEETGRSDRKEGYDEVVLNSAINHIEGCTPCMAKRNALTETTTPRPAVERKFWDFLVRLVVKATGALPQEISLDMPLGSLQITNILILLSATDRKKMIPTIYPDRMTLRMLAYLWMNAEEAPPENQRPALRELDVEAE